ncbi:MAG: hypothetical protein KA368_09620, partial [Acidobacteria bacterium]|nr:hypothetical protein [Acidobacteriota bacterium]
PKAQPISVTSGKAGAEETTRKAATATTPEAESYASVVSGIGGAFHHPSGTYIDEIQEQVLYPSEEVSTNEIAKRIFNPWQIFNGGFIWLGGAIIAFVIYFAAALEESSNHFIKIINDVINALLSNVYREIVLAKNWSQLSTALLPRFSSADNTWYLWGGALLLLLSLLVLASPFFPWLSKILFKTATGGSLGTSTKTQVRAGESQYIDYEISAKPEVPLWGITGLASILVFFGFYLLLPLNKPPILSFRLSLIIQYSIVWAVAAIALSLRYSEFLSKKSHRTIVQWHDWALTWVLTIAGLLSVTVGLRGFGGQLTAASLVSDLIFTLVGVGVFAGLIGLPIFAGGELLQPRREAPDESLSFGRKFLGRGLFGLWHAILQIVAPFLLTRGLLLMSPIRSVVWGLVTLIVLPALMWWVGKSLLKVCRRKLLLSRRGVLAIVWWIYGVLMLTLPYLWCKNEDLFPSVLITGWEAVAQLLLASLVGAVMACVWFGWYLGVCFAFNGHNNEVGGACRIEEFKQFIRFRLTKDGLTGYVIGIDKPEKNGQALKPRIIDVFHLHVKDGKCDKDKNDENKCRTV